jgi:hypothetical protein
MSPMLPLMWGSMTIDSPAVDVALAGAREHLCPPSPLLGSS